MEKRSSIQGSASDAHKGRRNLTLRHILLCSALLVILLGPSLAPTVHATGSTDGLINTPSEYDWPAFQHDATHSGYTLSPAPFTNHKLATGSVRGVVRASISAAAPYLYAVGATFIYALNASDLSQVWAAKIGSDLASTPAVLAGNVYVGSSDGNLWSLTAVGLNVNWKFHTGGPVLSSPAVDNGRLFVGSDDMNVYAISPSGQLIWSHATGGKVRSSPAVSGGVVAVGSDDGNLYLLDETNGNLIFSIPTDGAIESSPNFAGNVVYVGSNDTNIYAINTSTGHVIWQTPTKGAVIGSPVSTRDGRVLVGSLDGKLYSIFASDGQISWQRSTGAISSAVALAEGVNTNKGFAFDDLAYVSTLSGFVYGIESDTGNIIWKLQLAGPVRAGPTIAYTKLYVGDSTGETWELGSLRFATPVNTFDQSGQITSTFSSGSVITFGANAAWGKYGIRSVVNLTVTPPGRNAIPLLANASMIFFPAQNVNYNFYYTWKTAGLKLGPGTYNVAVSIADGHSKTGSPNPRPIGYVNFKTTFTISN